MQNYRRIGCGLDSTNGVYQNSNEKKARATLSEGKCEMTEGAKKELTVAVIYMIPRESAPTDSINQ